MKSLLGSPWDPRRRGAVDGNGRGAAERRRPSQTHPGAIRLRRGPGRAAGRERRCRRAGPARAGVMRACAPLAASGGYDAVEAAKPPDGRVRRMKKAAPPVLLPAGLLSLKRTVESGPRLKDAALRFGQCAI